MSAAAAAAAATPTSAVCVCAHTHLRDTWSCKMLVMMEGMAFRGPRMSSSHATAANAVAAVSSSLFSCVYANSVRADTTMGAAKPNMVFNPVSSCWRRRAPASAQRAAAMRSSIHCSHTDTFNTRMPDTASSHSFVRTSRSSVSLVVAVWRAAHQAAQRSWATQPMVAHAPWWPC